MSPPDAPAPALPAHRSEPWIASILFRAVADGRWRDAIAALDGGADPHFPNASGFNLFHHCALAKDGASARRVLDALAPERLRRLDALWPSKTPLMLAAKSDSPEVALWLLERGAATRPEDAPRALDLARQSGSLRAAGAILAFLEAQALSDALPAPSLATPCPAAPSAPRHPRDRAGQEPEGPEGGETQRGQGRL